LFSDVQFEILSNPEVKMLFLASALLTVMMAGSEPTILPLYSGPAPGSESWDWPETEQVSTDGIRRIANVTHPVLMVYQADKAKANGTAVIVCPGGGWRILAIAHEGEDVARWLNEQGVTAFILKYRVMRTGDEGEKNKEEAARRRKEAMAMCVEDGLSAVKLVRLRAAEWGLAKDRIGIMGFSAGGYLTAGVALQGSGESHADFAAPIYPATPEEINPPADAPPLFLVHADDDKTVPPVRTSLRLYTAWKQIGVPVEMHIYASGGHGFGMRRKNLPVDDWTARLRDWMGERGLLKGK
jgi:acetyl esterase/lipase